MKKYYFLLLCCLMVVTGGMGQDAPRIGVICTYDYKTTIATDQTVICPDSICPSLYLVSSVTGGSTDIEDVGNFLDMMERILTRKNLLVYVHGDHSILSDLLGRGAELASTYDVDLLIFAWASNSIENRSIKNYNASKQSVLLTTERFISSMEMISDYARKNGIECNVMFHSLGNMFAKQYARYLINNPPFESLCINNILLNAPCVWEYDHDIWVDVLARNIRNKVFITHNDNDAILKLASRFIEGGQLLGQTNIKRFSSNAIYMDFTEALKGNVNSRESHGYFDRSVVGRIPNAKHFYESVLGGRDINAGDSLIYSVTSYSGQFNHEFRE